MRGDTARSSSAAGARRSARGNGATARGSPVAIVTIVGTAPAGVGRIATATGAAGAINAGDPAGLSAGAAAGSGAGGATTSANDARIGAGAAMVRFCSGAAAGAPRTLGTSGGATSAAVLALPGGSMSASCGTAVAGCGIAVTGCGTAVVGCGTAVVGCGTAVVGCGTAVVGSGTAGANAKGAGSAMAMASLGGASNDRCVSSAGDRRSSPATGAAVAGGRDAAIRDVAGKMMASRR